MNYSFTVTKAGSEETPIEKIEAWDYNRVWLAWSKQDITIIYKYQHEDSESGKRHIHFHGMLTSPKKLKYDEMMMHGYSIVIDNMNKTKIVKGKKLTKQQHYDAVFSYCQHEERAKKKLMAKIEQEKNEAVIYARAMEAGTKRSQAKIKVKQTSDTLFKIVLHI